MSRLMSVAFTEDAVRSRRKTVTRRLGWTFVKPGDRLTLCRKVMGRKSDEPLVRIAEVEVVDVRREPLGAITAGDIIREGFATAAGHKADRDRFLSLFRDHMKADPDTEVTRIEWRYLASDERAPEPCIECEWTEGHDPRARCGQVEADMTWPWPYNASSMPYGPRSDGCPGASPKARNPDDR